ncbi:MAG TPA: hypothetical protein VMK31_02130 [Sphingomicrobium sp.]|nr:hypothetical protein [Sphingomicrobium sp.]
MMRVESAGLVIAALLCGCAQQPVATQAIAGEALGPVARCIPSDQILSRRLAGASAVDFELLGGAVYRNQFASACPGIERLGELGVVAVTSGGEGSRLCQGDRVKIFDPVEAQATGLAAYPECLLGNFHRVR